MPKSYSQLLKEREELEAAIEAARRRESEGVIKRIREAIQVYGLSAADLGYNSDGTFTPSPTPKPRTRAAKPAVKKPRTKKANRESPIKGVKKPIKYSDGNGNNWAGGGSMPVWLREKLNQGHSLEEFLVKKAA